MAQVVLTLHDYRMEALEKVMEDTGGVERFLQDYLIDLYSERVPFEEQSRIQKRIDAERQQDSPAVEKLPETVQPSEQWEAPLRDKARPLTEADVVFEEDVFHNGSLLEFKMNTYVTLDQALGVEDEMDVSADPDRPNTLLNAYVNFDLAAKQPENSLIAVLLNDDASDTMDVRYRLSAAETAMLQPMMDAYCKKKLGMSLAECGHRYEMDTQKRKNSHSNAQKSGNSGRRHRKSDPQR